MGDDTTGAERAWSFRSFWPLLVLAALCAGLFAPAARAAGATPPRTALLKAHTDLQALVRQAHAPGTRKLLNGATSELGGATAAALWLDPNDAAAPPAGTAVVADCRAALVDLSRLTGPLARSRARTAATQLILTADRQLAVRVIAEAAGGNRSLLKLANNALAAGGRASAGGRFAAAVGDFGIAWQDGFGALTNVVVTAATHVSVASLSSTANKAQANPAVSIVNLTTVNGQSPLTSNGKPELLFIYSRSCSACALESWAIVTALSQFGSFSNLQLSQFAAQNTTPAVAGFTFAGSSYHSSYLAFVPIELATAPGPAGYSSPPQLTSAQSALFETLDPLGTLPFYDLANSLASIGPPVQPSLASGVSWRQVASTLTDPGSSTAQEILGPGEALAYAVCQHLANDGLPFPASCSTLTSQGPGYCASDVFDPPVPADVARRRVETPVARPAVCRIG